jgi:hypothetical protein
MEVGFRASNGMYVEVERGLGGLLVATRNILTTLIKFVPIVLPDNTIALQAFDLRFLTVNPQTNILEATSVTPIGFSVIIEVPGLINKVSIKAPNGKYVYLNTTTGTLEAIGNTIEPRALFDFLFLADAPQLDEYTQSISGKDIALQASNGTYVSATPGGGPLLSGASSVGQYETFRFEYIKSNQAGILTANDRYVTAVNGGGSILTDEATQIGIFETYNIYILTNDNRIAIQTAGSRQIVGINVMDGPLAVNRPNVGPRELFRVIFLP